MKAFAGRRTGSGTSGRPAEHLPPRVVIIVENLPVPLDRRVWQEAGALRDAGYDVTIICPRMHGFTTPYEILEGITIYRHRIALEASGLLGFVGEYVSALIGEMRCAAAAWRRSRFDIIHVCNPPDLLFLTALPFKLLAGVRVVADVHDLWPEMFEVKFGRRGLLYRCVRLAERATLRLADAILVTNESSRELVKRRAPPTTPVFVVRTAPAQLDTSCPPAPELRNGRSYLIGYVGVMGSADGVHYLLEAAHHIVSTRGRRDVQFLLMGGGPEYEALVRQRDSLGLADYVSMPGRVSNEALFTGLRTMDLGVACDPINGYNDHCTMNKTLEYMAFAKPQVIFGTVEGRYSAGESAHYVTENSGTALGDAILDLLDNEPRRHIMGQIGHRRITTELNWDKSVEQLLKAYGTVGDRGNLGISSPQLDNAAQCSDTPHNEEGD